MEGRAGGVAAKQEGAGARTREAKARASEDAGGTEERVREAGTSGGGCNNEDERPDLLPRRRRGWQEGR